MRKNRKKLILDLIGFGMMVLTTVIFGLWILHELSTQGGF